MQTTELSNGKRCRACLEQYPKFQLYLIKSKNITIDGSEQTLADIYCQCTQLLCEDTDSDWRWICQNCTEKLVDFFQFRQLCINSYNAFKVSGSTVHGNDELKVEIVDVLCDTVDCIESNNSKVGRTETSFECVDFDPKDESNLMTSDGSTPKDELFPKDNEKNESNEQCVTSYEIKVDLEEQNYDEERLYQLPDYTNDDDHDHDDEEEAEDGEEEEDDWNANFDESSDSDFELESPSKSKQSQTKRQVSKKAKKPATTVTIKTAELYFKCDACPKKFVKKHRYEAHKRTHLGLKQWKCEHCDKEFQKYGTLRSHISSRHFDDANGQPVFICDVDGCGKSYSIKESLRVHMRQVHEGKKPNPTNRMCEQCGKSFKSNAALVKHSYIHTKITPFKCDICSKMFVSAYKLKEHVMRHKGIKNFVCPTCGLRKTTGHELRVHMKYHLTDTQFPCEICSVVFTRMANMKRHLRVVHCGVKAFPCPHCDRSFGKSETLKHHIMTHTGERPLACTVCDKRFIQPIALKTHMKTHNK